MFIILIVVLGINFYVKLSTKNQIITENEYYKLSKNHIIVKCIIIIFRVCKRIPPFLFSFLSENYSSQNVFFSDTSLYKKLI